MRKFGVYLLVAAILIGSLVGCGTTTQPVEVEPTPSSTQEPVPSQAEPTPEPEAETVESQIIESGNTDSAENEETEFDPCADSYWIAETYYSEDGEGAEGPHVLDAEKWFVDLVMCADGTARFRDIRESVCLMDDSYLDLTWEDTGDGHFLFYSKISSRPVLDGIYDNGVLSVEYMGMTLSMKQMAEWNISSMEYLPAELVGTWLMVSDETEGQQTEVMPNLLASLVIRTAAYAGPLELRADWEEMNGNGVMNDAAHDQTVSILGEVLYDGCGNDSWSVRIGPESTKDENGYPTEPEICATLQDYNTLLVQRSSTVDGHPIVSYQTYWRFPKIVSWRALGYAGLGDSNWVCTGYINSQGEDRSPPEGMEDFALTLNADQTCFAFCGDEVVEGTWQIENGGVILLRGNDDAFWFGGAVSTYSVETTYEVSDASELSLYYNGGILRLKMTGYG